MKRWGIYNQALWNPVPIEAAYQRGFDIFTHESQIDRASQWRGTGVAKCPGMALARGAICSIGINAYQVIGGVKVPCPSPSGDFNDGFDSVANGEFDSEVNDWIAALNSYQAEGGLVHALFHLEPSLDNAGQPSAGTNIEYKAAFAHLLPMFNAAGIELGWDSTSSDWRSAIALDWEPAAYDICSADFYPTADVTKTMSWGLGDFFDNATNNHPGKPILVRSTTCKEFTDAQAAAWFADASDTLLAIDAIDVWVGWDTDNQGLHDLNPGETFPTYVRNSATKTAFYHAAQDWSVSIHTITGVGNTDATLLSDGFVDITMDPRAYCVCEDNVLQFDPDVTTTLTINNKNLMFMDTARLEMNPSSSSVIHKIVFTNVDESLFSGGAARAIASATHVGTSATFTLTLPTGITNHHLTTLDKVTVAGVSVAGYNSAAGVPWQITAVTATTVTVTLATTPASDYVVSGSQTPTLTADTPTANDKGLWFMGGATCDMTGTTKLAWTRAVGDIAATDTSVLCEDAVTTWLPGDEVAIVPTDLTWTHYDERVVDHVSGSTVFFTAAITNDHPAFDDDRNGVTYGAELLNLTRNVRIEGQDATHRSHMMIHNTSAVAQHLGYTSFRYLGPRQNSDVVVGRWPVHLHKESDLAAGSTFTGLVVRNVGSHAFVTQHASNNVTNTDCIAHDVSTHPYWWDLGPNDAPDGVLWDHCVASKVNDGGTSTDANRMGGFLLGSTITDVGSTMRDCVAVGVAGTSNGNETSGFEWVFFGGASIGQLTPMVRGWNTPADRPNVSHNNKEYGIFIWCNENNSRGTHNLNDFVLYRNGSGGYTNGAYSQVFCHRRSVVMDNGYSVVGDETRCVSLEANSDLDSQSGKRWQVHNDGYFDANNRASCIRIGTPLLIHVGPIVQVLDCVLKNAKDGKVVLVQQSFNVNKSKPSIMDFVRCVVYDVGSSTPRELLTTDFTYENSNPPNTGVVAGLTHRVQARDDQSAYQVVFTTNDLSSKVVTTIAPFALAVQTSALNVATVGTSYSQTLSTNGKEQTLGVVTWALKHGSAALAPGLTISPQGVISGVPTLAGTYPVTVEVTDERGATAPKDYSLLVNSGAVLTITSSNAPVGFIGQPYDFPFTAENGTPPYVWSKQSGTVPPGLSASGSSMHGTPTTLGTFNMVLKVTDAVLTTATRALTFIIDSITPVITTASLAPGQQNILYAAQLAVTGGVAPFVFTSTGLPLPPGLSISPSGLISGTPNTPGTYPVTFHVVDSVAQTDDASYTITIQTPLVLEPIADIEGLVGQDFTFDFTGSASGGTGVYEFSILEGTSVLAPDLTFTIDGILSGTLSQDGDFPFTLQVTDQLTTQFQPVNFTVVCRT